MTVQYNRGNPIHCHNSTPRRVLAHNRHLITILNELINAIDIFVQEQMINFYEIKMFNFDEIQFINFSFYDLFILNS